jgi:sterol desaturase/sphingolipid hydroxylase (fatty acid hydroxylase superfamily)
VQQTLDYWRLFTAVFPAIMTLELGRYVIGAGLVSFILWAFWRAGLAGRKIQKRNATRADYARELRASFRTVLIFAATGFCMYLASRGGWLTIYTDPSERGPIYFTPSLIAMVLAHDAYFYWTHRAMHHPRLFRFFHRTHHKSHTPTPWTAYSFDAPEAFVIAAFVPAWIALVPMHDLAIYLFMTWQIARNVLGHAGVELSPVSGRPSRLFGWLNTTTHHDLHHQNARWNYGLYFSRWDRWMGTEHHEYQARVAQIVVARAAAEQPGPVAEDGCVHPCPPCHHCLHGAFWLRSVECTEHRRQLGHARIWIGCSIPALRRGA